MSTVCQIKVLCISRDSNFTASCMLNRTLIELSFAEFEDDPDLYILKPLQYVGIEVWQVPNIIVGQTRVPHHNPLVVSNDINPI